MAGLRDFIELGGDASAKPQVPDFSGHWFTTFGPMELTQENDRVHGFYGTQQNPCTVEGAISGGRFHFTYREPDADGEGWFELERHGRFSGEWRTRGSEDFSSWRGEREFEGIWETSFGLLRLVQEPSRVLGFYEGGGACHLEGQVEGDALQFQYREARSRGEGRFVLSKDLAYFEGEWRAAGAQQWSPWQGRRLVALRGAVWLVVIEAHWQRSYLEKDYAFGHMLREFFSRLPNLTMRQRFFEDEIGLERWCRELMYIPEPVAVVFASHGTADGLTVHGRPFRTDRLVESLRYADNVILLHFSCCMMMQEGKAGELARELREVVRFPISGYDRSVDWAASALIEFHYLDMVLRRGLAPARAAETVLRLVAYAGSEDVSDSPYPPAGFRILLPK